jgi:hypothetical protein
MQLSSEPITQKGKVFTLGVYGENGKKLIYILFNPP